MESTSECRAIIPSGIRYATLGFRGESVRQPHRILQVADIVNSNCIGQDYIVRLFTPVNVTAFQTCFLDQSFWTSEQNGYQGPVIWDMIDSIMDTPKGLFCQCYRTLLEESIVHTAKRDCIIILPHEVWHSFRIDLRCFQRLLRHR